MEDTARDSPHIAVDGAKLRNARRLARLTQTALADAAKVSAVYISRIESGALRVSPPVYGRLCDALGVTDPAALMAQPPAEP
jgi:transcriptional regulator with XRE-family HTH domain